MSITTPRFTQELETYARNLPDWLAQGERDHWVAIHGQLVVGIYPDFHSAYAGGAGVAGDAPFLVKQIEDVDRVERIHRIDWSALGPSDGA